MKTSRAFLTFVEQVAFSCGRYAFYNGDHPRDVDFLRQRIRHDFGSVPTIRQVEQALRFLASKGLVERSVWRVWHRTDGRRQEAYRATPKLIKATSACAAWKKAVAA